MKKIILGVVLLIVLAIGGGIFYVLSNLDGLVKMAIEKYGSEATQTAVRVSSVRIALSDGKGTIKGLTVANTKGFDAKYAFSLGEITTKIDINSIKKEPYVIDEITIRAPQVFMEMNADKQTNLNELKKNLSGGSASANKAAAKDKSASEPRLIIRRVLFTEGDISAKIVPLNNKDYKLKLPTINMANLGGKNGATASELAKEIMNRLTDQAREQLKKQGYDAEIDKLKAKAKEKVDAEKAKLKEKTDSKVDAEKQKAADKLKGLFNK